MPTSDANDHWYWRKTLYGKPGDPDQSMTVDFSMPDPVKDGSTFPLKVMIWGYFRSESHRVEVRFNNSSLGEQDFYGSAISNSSLLYEADVSSNLLDISGENTIKIIAVPHPGSPDPYYHRILVDWIELKPSRDLVATGNRLAFSLAPAGTEDVKIAGSGFSPASVQVDIYDVTEPDNVLLQQLYAADGGVTFNRTVAVTRSFEIVTAASRLSPRSIKGENVPSPLLSDHANQADMIIITDPSLDSALTPLRTKRTAQGLLVKTVFVQDIFDEFSFGLYSTEAIKDFLGHAFSNWAGDPAEFVLLAGEGSYDHRDVKDENGPGGNLVPVFLRSGIDSNLGEAASDNQYVDFDGDDLADMLLGRLPARDPAELTIMVQKIVNYESQPATAPLAGQASICFR